MTETKTTLEQALQTLEGPEQNEALWEVLQGVDFNDHETVKVLAEKLYF